MTDNYLSQTGSGAETPSVSKAVVTAMVDSKLGVLPQPQKVISYF